MLALAARSRNFADRKVCFGEPPNASTRAACAPQNGVFHRCGIYVLLVSHSFAAEVIPPKPDRYFNDYAGVVSKEAASRV